ncbi:MAG: carboxypeptidase-like regulatory domain-containing protein [Bacteroidetes bacterium]|nr:carboxypeptidase-like regulatory domain-containing protein [Bacteroidota bacterium]
MQSLRIALFILLLTLSQVVNGQILNGIVRSESEPLEAAYIYWKSFVLTNTQSDSAGHFTINKIPNQDTLIVTMVGYEPTEIIISKEQNFTEIVLKPSTVLKTVNIGDVKAPKILSKKDVRHISRFSEREFTKAACCNLSESFETISAVDVTTSDAVTGIRQIQMMGFSGIYVQTQVDNMPFASGLIASSGLTYIPGIFVKGMQLAKGVGSVTNGYDGMTGSLNIELRKPTHKERLIINGYFNPMNLRPEGNIVFSQQVSKNWATTAMLHGSGTYAKADINNDGFQDFPLQNNLNFSNAWMYMKNNWEGNIGVKYLNYAQKLGINDLNKTQNIDWQSSTKNERIEVEAMLGHIFEDHKHDKDEHANEHANNSMGFRVNSHSHTISNYFGGRKYDANEKVMNLKWVFQGLAGNSFHQYMVGATLYGNQIGELFSDNEHNLNLSRNEWIPGVFFEWTESGIKNLTLVGGIRYDYHNYFGSIITPRLHGKWTIDKKNEIRFGGGRGQRTSNPFADYQGIFSSGRKVILPVKVNNGFYGLQQEVSWNTGFSYIKNFKLFYRPASLEADYYYTWFDEQLQVDRDFKSSELRFYNISALGLKSYSHSASIGLDFSPAKRFDVRMSYRFIDSRSGYIDGTTRLNPLISPHRAFVNVSYENRKGWVYDATVNWQSEKRLPQGASLPEELKDMPAYSPSYTGIMAQITKKFNKQFEAYIGGENLLNIVQKDLIRMASNPSSPYFDPTLVWGPSLGITFYAGFRYYIW